jgi:phosphoenolpyruvate synthase/pyruvate phosphate dikinase
MARELGAEGIGLCRTEHMFRQAERLPIFRRVILAAPDAARLKATVTRLRAQVEQGTWTLDRPLANGQYTYELWAVDAMGNRSTTQVGEVRVRG